MVWKTNVLIVMEIDIFKIKNVYVKMAPTQMKTFNVNFVIIVVHNVQAPSKTNVHTAIHCQSLDFGLLIIIVIAWLVIMMMVKKNVKVTLFFYLECHYSCLSCITESVCIVCQTNF